MATKIKYQQPDQPEGTPRIQFADRMEHRSVEESVYVDKFICHIELSTARAPAAVVPDDRIAVISFRATSATFGDEWEGRIGAPYDALDAVAELLRRVIASARIAGALPALSATRASIDVGGKHGQAPSPVCDE